MAAYIVEFPGDWYLKTTRGIVTGDKAAALKFATDAEARAALADTKNRFKPKAFKAARIVEVSA